MSEKFRPNLEQEGKTPDEKMPEIEAYPNLRDSEIEKRRLDEARQKGRSIVENRFGALQINVKPGFIKKGSGSAQNKREGGLDDDQLRRTSRRLSFMADKKNGSDNFETQLHEIFGREESGQEPAPHEKILSRVEKDISLDEFTKELENLFENDPWLRGQIDDWELFQRKSRNPKEPKFRLVIFFENNRLKRKREKTIIAGTYNGIMDVLKEELGFHKAHLRVVGDEE
jgi:hypothetical protein